MTIDTPFVISKNNILSVTVRFTKDSGFYERLRMQVPLDKIKGVEQDIYLILVCEKDAVECFASQKNSEQLLPTNTMNLFHIGELKAVNQNSFDKLVGLVKKLFIKN